MICPLFFSFHSYIPVIISDFCFINPMREAVSKKVSWKSHRDWKGERGGANGAGGQQNWVWTFDYKKNGWPKVEIKCSDSELTGN